MPTYAYYCPANGRTVEVRHGIDQRISSWGELCYCAQIELGDTDVTAPVEKRIYAPAIAVPTSNTDAQLWLGWAPLFSPMTWSASATPSITGGTTSIHKC